MEGRKMPSVKGIFDGNVILPLTRINHKANTMVIITFLEEESNVDELNLIKDAQEKYRILSKEFDFGETPDEEYAKELMAVYNETFPKN